MRLYPSMIIPHCPLRKVGFLTTQARVHTYERMLQPNMSIKYDQHKNVNLSVKSYNVRQHFADVTTFCRWPTHKPGIRMKPMKLKPLDPILVYALRMSGGCRLQTTRSDHT